MSIPESPYPKQGPRQAAQSIQFQFNDQFILENQLYSLGQLT